MRLRLSLALVFASILFLGALPATAGETFAPAFALPGPSGDVVLPDPDSNYRSPNDIHFFLANGGELTAEMKAEHHRFFDIESNPGGISGGTIETFQSSLRFCLTGLAGGPLEGVSFVFEIPAKAEVHAGPQGQGQVRSFETTMMSLEGSLQGPNEVFDSFELVAGDAHGLPSPGHTTLIEQDDGSFLIDSRFNVSFRVHFIGSPRGPLAGYEDEIEGQVTMIAESVQ